MNLRPVVVRLAAIVLVICWIGGVHAHGVTLKVHHYQPADSVFHTQFLLPWAEKLKKESGGLFRFQFFPAMQMGGEPAQLLDQVKSGTADIVFTMAEFTAERFPAFEVFELPLATRSAQGASRALWEYVRTNDDAKREFNGVRLLAVHQHTAPVFHMVKKPINSLADLAGQKIYAPSIGARKLLATMGASAADLPFAQVSDALAKGELDGALLPWTTATELKLHESVKFHSEPDGKAAGINAAVFIFAMNPNVYKTLSDELKKVITANSGADTSAWLGKVFDESASAACKLATERGNAVNTLPAQESAKWPAQAIIDARIRELDQLGLEGRTLVDNARAALAEHDAGK